MKHLNLAVKGLVEVKMKAPCGVRAIAEPLIYKAKPITLTCINSSSLIQGGIKGIMLENGLSKPVSVKLSIRVYERQVPLAYLSLVALITTFTALALLVRHVANSR